MDKLLNIAGNTLGALGLLCCFVSGVARVAGSYHFLNYEAMTVFSAGTGLMVAACLVKLHQLVEKQK